MPSVKSIKLMTIIKAKWGNTAEGINAQLFIKLSALSGLITCIAIIKGSFD